MWPQPCKLTRRGGNEKQDAGQDLQEAYETYCFFSASWASAMVTSSWIWSWSAVSWESMCASLSGSECALGSRALWISTCKRTNPNHMSVSYCMHCGFRSQWGKQISRWGDGRNIHVTSSFVTRNQMRNDGAKLMPEGSSILLVRVHPWSHLLSLWVYACFRCALPCRQVLHLGRITAGLRKNHGVAG